MIVGFFLKKNVIILGGKQISVQYLPHEKYIKLIISNKWRWLPSLHKARKPKEPQRLSENIIFNVAW